ncbi:hypothetical protein [Parachryseolinea silvisoli]|uniref:hypothetical protein n=1 Tax=Parachryseolinea silvisoli TaxID=2873601 RepID=UPI0022658090|nr:hypothetical protein [Parachryseolinea silvisoli]MCD9019933.1 hypothetical protein [Parachryseolinea silvisoli]
MRVFFLCSILLPVSFIFSTQPCAAAIRDSVADVLQTPFFEKLYANTYYSLLDRLNPDGYLEESLSGAYDGMYCRTTGPMVLLLLETGRYQEAERMISFVLNAVAENDMERIPHVIGQAVDGRYPVTSNENQIDGQAHVLLAWARLAVQRGHTAFEDKTWPLVSKLMERTCDRTYLQVGWWSIEPGLVRNLSFEHSREGRRWDTWDLLTQSFVGAALTDMITVAKRRGAGALGDNWSKKLGLLRQGIAKHLTVQRNGKTTYLEMRLPDSNGGVPFLGMGWVCLAPVAAGWEALEHGVMVNTVAEMQRTLLKTTRGLAWMPTDGYPDGTVSNEIIGKGLGWEMEFCRQEKDYTRVAQILKLIGIVNAGSSIYMEGGWLDAAGIKPSQKLTDKDLASMKEAVWKSKDAGNGEQCAWWCWAMARLRKEKGLPAVPKRKP